ncbi:MAG: tripartite tricarboxylate transporter substrate binding protein [Desulfobacterales bacterium]|nr:tripartite tricarboxylate transporter substrate binding protein [Desulfobacterales bacterium]
MNILMKHFVVSCAVFGLVVGIFSIKDVSAENEWKPNKPINLVVPWGAGGATDGVSRQTAMVLEGLLGQKIVVVNQPGASGSVGTKHVLDKPKKGLYWTAGAVKDLGVYKVQGLLDTTLDDWHLFLNFAIPNVVAVNASAPYKDFGGLIEAFKADPGKIKVATAGVNSAGHTAIEMIKSYTGIDYKHVSYDGGNPAVIATVAGECDVVPQLAKEEVDMLKAGKLRALAVLADAPLKIDGYDQEIPSVKKWIPDFVTAPIYFGIFVPKGVPDEVISTLTGLWNESLVNDAGLKTFAAQNAMIFDPAAGDTAMKKAFPMVQLDAWLKFDSGDATIDPSTIGIPRP